MRLDADARVQGEPYGMAPPAHVLGRLRVEQAGTLEEPQYPVAHQVLNGRDIGPELLVTGLRQ